MIKNWHKIIVPFLIISMMVMLPLKAEAAVAVVQHKTGQTNASQVTVPITVTGTAAGNLLVVATGNAGTRTVTKVCTDGTTCAAGNSFTHSVGCDSALGTDEAEIWYLTPSTAGVTTITISFSGSSGTFNKEGWAWEVSGFTNPTTDGCQVVNSGTAAASTATGASITTTATAGFVAAVVISSANITVNPKAGNEFTGGGDISATSDAACSLVSASAAAHQPTWTTTTGATFNSSTGAFKETATVSVVKPRYLSSKWYLFICKVGFKFIAQ